MSNVLIISGMHRSGTSLVANWIQRLGINIGDRLLPGNVLNPNGFFEDTDFLRAHEEVLTDLEMDPHGLTKIGTIELNSYNQTKLKYLVKFKSSLRDEWGWKEPRTCLFLDEYRTLLPDARKLFLYRDYRMCVDSLLRREYKAVKKSYSSRTILHKAKFALTKHNIRQGIIEKQNKYLNAWITYNTNIIRSCKESGDKALLLSVDDFIQADAKIYSKLVHWGFKVSYIPFSSVYKDELLNKSAPSHLDFDPGLRHKAEELTAALLATNA